MSDYISEDDVYGKPATSYIPEEDVYGERPSRTPLSVAKDTLVSGAKGVVGLGEAAVGLGNLATGGLVGKAADAVGYDPNTTQKVLSDLYSPAQQQANRNVEEAEGFVDTVKAYADNPSGIYHQVVETFPSMLGGAGVGRKLVEGAVKVAPKLMAKVSPKLAGVLGGALGEGGVGGGGMAEQIRQQNEDKTLTGKQALAAVGAGAGTSIFGLVGGRIAQKLGLTDIDTLMASGFADDVVRKKGAAEVAKRIVGGGISEGVFEELPQSVQETMWQNAATGKPLMEGVPESAASSIVLGGVMGAGANLLPQRQAPVEPVSDPVVEQPKPTGVISKALGNAPIPTRQSSQSPESLRNAAGTEVSTSLNDIEGAVAQRESERYNQFKNTQEQRKNFTGTAGPETTTLSDYDMYDPETPREDTITRAAGTASPETVSQEDMEASVFNREAERYNQFKNTEQQRKDFAGQAGPITTDSTGFDRYDPDAPGYKPPADSASDGQRVVGFATKSGASKEIKRLGGTKETHEVQKIDGRFFPVPIQPVQQQPKPTTQGATESRQTAPISTRSASAAPEGSMSVRNAAGMPDAEYGIAEDGIDDARYESLRYNQVKNTQGIRKAAGAEYVTSPDKVSPNDGVTAQNGEVVGADELSANDLADIMAKDTGVEAVSRDLEPVEDEQGNIIYYKNGKPASASDISGDTVESANVRENFADKTFVKKEVSPKDIEIKEGVTDPRVVESLKGKGTSALPPPVVFVNKKGKIEKIDGAHRIKAAQEAGVEKITVYMPKEPATTSQQVAANVAPDIKAGDVEDGVTEHSGHKIYKTVVGGKDYFAVQIPSNKGTLKTLGDTLHATIEEAKAEADFITKSEAAKKTFKIKEEEDSKAKAEAKAVEADTDGFADTFKPLVRGKIIKDLKKQLRFKDGVFSIKEKVRALVKEGKATLETFEEDRIKPMSRMAAFRADNATQAAHDKKVKEGGKKTVYLVNGSDLGKTGYDYAKYLESKEKPDVPETDFGDKKTAPDIAPNFGNETDFVTKNATTANASVPTSAPLAAAGDVSTNPPASKSQVGPPPPRVPKGKEGVTEVGSVADSVMREFNSLPESARRLVKSISVYGSYLKDSKKARDIDVHFLLDKTLVNTPEDVTEAFDFIEGAFDKRAFEKTHGKGVDILVETDGTYAKNGVVIYSKDAPTGTPKVTKPVTKRVPVADKSATAEDSGQKFSPEQAIKVAADDIESLRPVDTYRVLSGTSVENREDVRQYIVKNHSDNQRMLDAVRKAMDELKPPVETNDDTDEVAVEVRPPKYGDAYNSSETMSIVSDFDKLNEKMREGRILPNEGRALAEKLFAHPAFKQKENKKILQTIQEDLRNTNESLAASAVVFARGSKQKLSPEEALLDFQKRYGKRPSVSSMFQISAHLPPDIDGFVSDGGYMIDRSIVPNDLAKRYDKERTKGGRKIPTSFGQDILAGDKKGSTITVKYAGSYDARDDFRHGIFIDEKTGERLVVNADYVEYILSIAPKAEMVVSGKFAQSPIRFVVDGKPIAAIMPLNKENIKGGDVIDFTKADLKNSVSAPTRNAASLSELTTPQRTVADALIASGRVKVVTADEAVAVLEGMGVKDARFMVAWHGSPHDHDGFSMEKVGSGEGAQAYGFGLYFAGSKEVSEWYRDKLSETETKFFIDGKELPKWDDITYIVSQLEGSDYDSVMQELKTWLAETKNDIDRTAKKTGENSDDVAFLREQKVDIENNIELLKTLQGKEIRAEEKNTGKLYQVELAPQEDEYLLWDKPLSEQSEKVKAALKSDSVAKDTVDAAQRINNDKGRGIYSALAVELGTDRTFTGGWGGRIANDKAASEYLHSLGIRGIKYLDGSSRSKGDGNYNYVIFNDQDVSITAKYSKDGAIQAFVDKQGITHIIPENIAKGNMWPVFKHEVGVHVGRALQTSAGFQRLLASIESRKDETGRTGEAIRAAMKRVPENTNPEHYWEEILAYSIEEAPTVGYVRQFISLIKNLLVKLGFDPKIFTVADLSALAEVAVGREASNAETKRPKNDSNTQSGKDVQNSVRDIPPRASTTEREKNGDASTTGAKDKEAARSELRNSDTVRPDGLPDNIRFRKWHRKSKVKTVVYHGSKTFGQGDASTYTFADGDISTANTKSPGAGLGYFFAEEPTDAMPYAGINGKSFPMYLRIEEPFETNSFDLPAFKNRYAAKQYQRMLKNKGYDGIYLADEGHWIAFEPGQAKSADQNNGEYSTKSYDVRYSLAATAYEANRNISVDWKSESLRAARSISQQISEGMDKFLGAISTRLSNINPKLKAKIRQLDFRIGTAQARDIKAIRGMLDKAKGMSKGDFADWDFARKNSDINKIAELVKKYSMENEYQRYRETLDRIRDEAISVGLGVGYIEDYSPRILKDSKGFLNAIGKGDDWPSISRRLAERAKELEIEVADMTDEMKADIVSDMILGGGSGLGTPRNTKERKIKEIPPELNRFYMASDAALVSYIHNMRKTIEARKFFGKMPEKVSKAKQNMHSAQSRLRDVEASENPDKGRIAELKEQISSYEDILERYKYQSDYKDNISSYVVELVTNGEVDDSQQNRLVEILNARFHEMGTRGLVQAYKNFSYLDTMGSPISALTQIGDMAWSVYFNGLIPTMKYAYKSVAKTSRITKEDVGIERIAQEFADSDTLSNAVAKVFKFVGLEKMDAIGKEVLLNGALEKYENMAAKEPAKLSAEIEYIFGNETDSVVNDLLNKTVSDNVKLLVYSKLLDFQPAALSEMSEQYLKAGNGRVFYMLKSYTLKQFDVYRNEAYNKIKTGKRAEVIQGLQNLAYLSMCLVLANAGADELKDLVLRRETSFQDRTIDNVLRLFGVSKYVTWTARKEGVGWALSKQILPPFKFIDSASKDIMSAGDDKGLRSLDSIPLAGKLAYWHLGRGKKSDEELWEGRFAKERKRLTDLKERSERDPEIAVKKRNEIAKLARLNRIQATLNKRQQVINKLEARSKRTGQDYSKRISALEKNRVQIMRSYLESRNA